MKVAARIAVRADAAALAALYDDLAAEMVALRDMWPLADGVPEPAIDAFAELTDSDDWTVVIGTIDDVPLGFLAATRLTVLPQAGDLLVGSIRLIYTDSAAREVGVGEAMMEHYLAAAQSAGIERFDAHVSPGHRQAKNFFESNGFRARSIVMHLGDRR